MTTRQWVAFMLGLWACFFAAWFLLDGAPRAIVAACITLGFAGSAVERYRNWQRTRR